MNQNTALFLVLIVFGLAHSLAAEEAVPKAQDVPADVKVEASQNLSQEDILEYRKTVVNLRVKTAHFFGINRAGTSSGTGFIVDTERGWIVTNRHVVPEYAAQVEVIFHNGSTHLAKRVYYDLTHDFAVLQYKAKEVKTDLKPVKLGSFFNLKLGDPVVLIGNNDAEEYSLKKGLVINLEKNKGDRHSLTLQTSFDRAGGSSGSPVWNAKGEVIGIHFKGSDVTSFELPIDYVKDKLDKLLKGQKARRGELGVKLGLIKTERAKKFLRFPKNLADILEKKFPHKRHLIVVGHILEDFVGAQKLEVGDIIWTVNRQVIGSNLYLFDKLVDQNISRKLSFEVIRNGRLKRFSLVVLNGEVEKVKKYLRFAGSTFHGITPSLRFNYDIRGEGVYLSQAEPGTSFDGLGIYSKKVKNRKAVVIYKLNGREIRNIDDLIQTTKKLKHEQNIVVVYQDLMWGSPKTFKTITLDLKTSASKIFKWNASSHVWGIQPF